VRRLGQDRLSDLGFAVVLTSAWVLFWGDVSIANVLSGAAASLLLLSVFPLGHDITVVRHHLRPVAAVRLALYFFGELGLSTLLMVGDVVGGRRRERPGVVACPLRVGAPGLLTFLTNLLAMTPGTMPIDVTEDPPVIYLHVLRLDDPEAVRATVSRLEALAVAALGDADALAAVARPAPPPPHLRPKVGP
jgi:multicomponent Na+:H+ antiporter subunit E